MKKVPGLSSNASTSASSYISSSSTAASSSSTSSSSSVMSKTMSSNSLLTGASTADVHDQDEEEDEEQGYHQTTISSHQPFPPPPLFHQGNKKRRMKKDITSKNVSDSKLHHITSLAAAAAAAAIGSSHHHFQQQNQQQNYQSSMSSNSSSSLYGESIEKEFFDLMDEHLLIAESCSTTSMEVAIEEDILSRLISKPPTFAIPKNLYLDDIKTVSLNPLLYRGPTTESNWIILDRLMMGAYPASLHDAQHFEVSRRLLNCGIRTFVCLQDEYDHHAKPEQWKSGKRIRPYIYDTAEIFQKDKSIIMTGKESKTLEMLHVAIKDCSITTDKLVQDLAEEVCLRLCRGEVMYVHCWGGHGRTGTLVATVLGMMFALDANEALARTQHFHDLRHSPLGAQSPQTVQQRNQVRRILNEYHIINQGQSFIDRYLEGKAKSSFSPFTLFKMTLE